MLTAGARIGPYEIVASLGAGGMGEVYRARDTNLNRDVAIKVLPPAFSEDAERLARFTREAHTLASLNHPNIAAIYGIEVSESQVASPGADAHPTRALVMELVEGRDLSEVLAGGALAFDDAMAMARQMADALEAAHQAGIVHRDLKPANIKVRDDGTVKVLDFGLAKAMGAGTSEPSNPRTSEPTMTSPAMTQAGVILGTAAYMSPEQAKGRPVDARADVWAFGVILYEMLTGERIFGAETVGESMAAVLTREPDWSVVPGRARRLLQACLQKEPKQRLRHVADAFLLLDTVEETSAVARAKPLLPWVAGAAVAGVIVGAVAMALWPRGAAVAPMAFHEPAPDGTRVGLAPVVSPDGRHLAMVARGADGRGLIWLRTLSDDAPRLVEGTAGAVAVFWSPDSAELGFANGEDVRRVPRTGGVPRLVASGVKAEAAVWTPGGEIVFGGPDGIYRVEDDGGTPGRMLSDRTGLYTDLSLLPSGDQIIFRQFGGETGLYVLDLGSEAVTRLEWDAAATAAGGAVSFVAPDVVLYRDSQGLVGRRLDLGRLAMAGDPFPIAGQVGSFAGSASGALSYVPSGAGAARLNWRDREGRLLETVGTEGDYRQVFLSPSGRRILFVRADPATGNLDLWIQDQQSEAPIRFTTDPDVDHLPIFSPKEDEVIWEGHRGGALTIFRRRSDLSDAVRVERQWNRSGGPSDWSPDGTFALYASMEAATRNDLWVIPLDGTTEPFPLLASEFGESDGRISQDGRWLAYVSDASGRQEIYLQRLDHWTLVGGPVPVSSGGGTQPRWRADGSELFYIRDGAVMAVTLTPGSDHPVGATRALFTGSVAGDAKYAVSPDGEKFLLIDEDATSAAAPVVILNWSSGLAKR